jgi:hypothetical protein
MDSILALCCRDCSGINRVFAVTLEDLLDSLKVALITSLKKLFFLFLLFTEVPIPHLIHHLFKLGQLIDALEDFIYFILLINELDFVFIKILDRENDIIFINIFRLIFSVEKTDHVVLRRLQLTFLEANHITHGHLFFDLGVFKFFNLTQILHPCEFYCYSTLKRYLLQSQIYIIRF